MRILLDKTIRIKRMKGPATGKQSLVTTGTAEANLQPLGKDRQQYSEGVFGKTFIAYVGIEVDVKVGDRVVDQDGIYYLVSDMVERDFGAFPFRELIIKKTK